MNGSFCEQVVIRFDESLPNHYKCQKVQKTDWIYTLTTHITRIEFYSLGKMVRVRGNEWFTIKWISINNNYYSVNGTGDLENGQGHNSVYVWRCYSISFVDHAEN